MKEIKLSKKQNKEMDKIVKWFLHPKKGALTCITDPIERGMTSAKILSRLACLQDKLTDHIKELK